MYINGSKILLWMRACQTMYNQTIHRRLKIKELDTPSAIRMLTETSGRYQIDVMLAILLAFISCSQHLTFYSPEAWGEHTTHHYDMYFGCWKMLKIHRHAKSSWRMRNHNISRYVLLCTVRCERWLCACKDLMHHYWIYDEFFSFFVSFTSIFQG